LDEVADVLDLRHTPPVRMVADEPRLARRNRPFVFTDDGEDRALNGGQHRAQLVGVLGPFR
jgi:hypothetical protein